MQPGMFQLLLAPLLALAHIGLWVSAAMTLGTFQGRWPAHFGADGQPDAWTAGPWWFLPLIATAMTALFIGALFLARRLARTSPQWVNLPRKRDWLALPADARLRALRPAEGLLLGFALFMNLTFVSITLDSYAIARGAQAAMSMAKVITILVCMAIWLVLSIIRIRQAIGDEVRAQRQAAAPAQ